MCFWKERPDANRLLIRLERLFVTAQLKVGSPQVQMAFGGVEIEAYRFLEGFHCILVLPECKEAVAEVIMRQGKIGLDPDRLFCGPDRVMIAALPVIGPGEVVVRLRTH